MLTLLRDLRDGYSVLTFIDGNLGVGADSKDQGHRLSVTFLGASLYARTGMAHLSRMAKCPILPVVTRRDQADPRLNHIEVLGPIMPELQDREAHALNVVSELWRILAEKVKRVPTQWESWRYIDRSLDLASLAIRYQMPERTVDELHEILFNDHRYAISDDEKAPILFDRVSYRSYFISRALIDFLREFVGNPRTRDFALSHSQMTSSALARFIERGILSAVPSHPQGGE